MSDTPRTDAETRQREIRNLNSGFTVEEVYADFARQLERELIDAIDLIKRHSCNLSTPIEAHFWLKDHQYLSGDSTTVETVEPSDRRDFERSSDGQTDGEIAWLNHFETELDSVGQRHAQRVKDSEWLNGLRAEYSDLLPMGRISR